MAKVPTFKEPGLSAFLSSMIVERDRLAETKLSAISANKSVLLFSPSEKVYEVTVSDAGVLVVTQVSG